MPLGLAYRLRHRARVRRVGPLHDTMLPWCGRRPATPAVACCPARSRQFRPATKGGQELLDGANDLTTDLELAAIELDISGADQ